MRRINFIFAVLFGVAGFVHGQVVSDDFSDMNFDMDPTWAGSSAQFIVNTNEQLQLNDVATGQSYMATSFASTSLNDREWNCWIKQSFAGSDNNQSRFYLAASGTVLGYSGSGSAGVQGYFIKLGEAGSLDAIRFYRDDGVGTPVLLGSGPDATVAASFEIRIRVLRDNTGGWTVFADPSGGIAYQLQASFIDNTYSTASALGMVCTYTTSNATKFYFDDIYFGDEIVDTTAPGLVLATATDALHLDVQFDEALTTGSAEDESFYNVIGIGNPSSALQDIDQSLVHLAFDAPFPANTTLTLEVNGTTDFSGNATMDASINFVFVVPAIAFPRAVVFNEVLADENPTVGLPEAEFVELFNASDDAYNLNNWQFVNTTTVKLLPSYTLLPGEFVVLCEDDFAGLFANAIGIASFTALTNSGDSLTLLDDQGQIVDILVYSVDWFETPEKADGGWSLEQVNPYLSCQSASNWKESQDPNGGTPSIQNSVFNNSPDVIAPEIIGVSVNAPDVLLVNFSETMDENSLADIVVDLIPFIDISDILWLPGIASLQLTTSSELQQGVTYTLSISGLKDCSGNEMTAWQENVLLGAIPSEGEVLINEILADPTPQVLLPEAEFIELYNHSDHLLDLHGCSLNGAVFEQQVLLAPGEFLLVADLSDALAFLAFEDKVFLPDFPSLTNTGMELILKDPDDAVLDLVDYSIDWYHDPSKDDGGWTLERINPDDPCSSESNWSASVNSHGGTPGAINSIYSNAADTKPPVLLYVLAEPQESMTLIFDDPLDASTAADIVLTLDGALVGDANPTVSPAQPNELVLHLGELEPGTVVNFAVGIIADCWGNATEVQGKFSLPLASAEGDLVINEVLSDPFDNGYDYVEVYNVSSHALSLSGWRLGNESNGAMGNLKEVTDRELLMLPGEYFALTLNNRTLPEFYPFTRLNRTWEMEEFPSYNNDDGTVYLVTPGGDVSDQFTYSSDYHFPLLNSTEGVSLERIDPLRPTDDATNWHSAAESQGFGTPGYMNSQAMIAGISDAQFEIHPEIFSPDNDGYNDVVTFNYTADEPGLTGNIFIFDSNGKRVRHLMRNELLGIRGSISWDGFDEERQPAGIGIYVVYAEFFSTDGRVSKIRKSCVLAHSLN